MECTVIERCLNVVRNIFQILVLGFAVIALTRGEAERVKSVANQLEIINLVSKQGEEISKIQQCVVPFDNECIGACKLDSEQ